jgi:hypothetical protein
MISSIGISRFKASLNAFITRSRIGMTIGKPNTAINAALFPALDAIAETIVNELANPIQPRTNAGKNNHKLNGGNPRKIIYNNRLKNPRDTIKMLLYIILDRIIETGAAMLK